MNQEKAETWLMLSAINGNSAAQCLRGMVFEASGVYGDALYWYQQAASQGNNLAQQLMVVLQNRIGTNGNQATRGETLIISKTTIKESKPYVLIVTVQAESVS